MRNAKVLGGDTAAPAAAVRRPLLNVALGKPTTQSSDSGDRDSTKPANRNATSGKKTGGFGFHTKLERMPWWMVDLQRVCEIQQIMVFNREDANPDKAKTMSVSVGLEADGPWHRIHQCDGRFGGALSNAPLTIVLEKPAPARYVRLQLRETTNFHLDEVEVYATLDADDPNLARVSAVLESLPPETERESGSDIVNSDAWNRAAFATAYNVDLQRMVEQWFHGLPHIEVDPGVPFDGKIKTLRLQGRGGWGNAVYELINACMLARRMKCDAVETVNAEAAGDLPFAVDDILIAPPRSGHTSRPAMDGSFYWPRGADGLLGSYSAEFALETINRFVRPAYRKYLNAAGCLGDHVLALHFRAGDIFEPGPMIYHNYVQPPAAFYLKAVNYALDRLGVTAVHLVFQDHSNPSVDIVIDYLVSKEIPYTTQSSELFEDVTTLLSARHIAVANSTFPEAIGLLSQRLQTYFAFRMLSPQPNIEFWIQSRVEDVLRAKGVRTFVISDPDTSYIAPNMWHNTPEQLELMRTFPETKLRLLERLGPADFS